MGLDTSHDCWHGSYGSFNSFRYDLAKLANIDLSNMIGFGGLTEFPTKDVEPLVILLNHSDCDGIIELEDTKPLATRLLHLLYKTKKQKKFKYLFDEEDGYLEYKIIQFATGLLEAYKNNEIVDFH